MILCKCMVALWSLYTACNPVYVCILGRVISSTVLGTLA